MFENDKKVRKANPDEDLLVVIEEEKTAPRITQVNGEFIYLSIHGFGKHCHVLKEFFYRAFNCYTISYIWNPKL